MASSFTTNLRVENPTPGDPAVRNIWGTILNTGRSLYDTAIAGVLSLNVAGAANVVLTQVDGAADQSRNAHYILTGVLTGNINVLWPALSRNFSVLNNTSGAFTLACGVNNGGVPLGLTVTVPQGGTMLLVSDGTDVKSRITVLVSPTGVGMAPVNALDIGVNQNSGTVGSVQNLSTGSAARALWRATNGTSKGELIQHGTNFTSSGVLRQNGIALLGDGAGGLTLGTTANQPVYFAVNSTQVAQFSGTAWDFNISQNASSTLSTTNANAGVAAAAALAVSNGTQGGSLIHYGTAFTTAGINRQDGTKLTASGAGGLTLATSVNQPIYLGINGAQVAQFTGTGEAIAISANSTIGLSALNANVGAAAIAALEASNGTELGGVRTFGTAYTTAGLAQASRTQLYASGTLVMSTTNNTPVIVGVNNVEITRVTSAGLGIGMTPVETLDITKDQNALSKVQILNANAGTLAGVEYTLNTTAAIGGIRQFGAGYATSGMRNAGWTEFYGSGPVSAVTYGNFAIVFGVNEVEVGRFDPTDGLRTPNTTKRVYLPSSSAAGANVVVNGTYHRLTTGTTISGVAGGVDGRMIILGTDGGNRTVQHENAGSTAANRFDLPGGTDIVISDDGTAMFIYNGISSRWNLIAFSG